MDHRLYFVLGDLFANLVVGAVAGWACALLIGVEWNMFIAMVIAMVIGMLVGLFLFFPLGILFGAMEVMLPTMFSGMMSGMAIGMWAAMAPVTASQGLQWGAVVGLICLAIIWILNAGLRGRRSFGEEG
jgi:Na+/citrate or Na+/malate symporter